MKDLNGFTPRNYMSENQRFAVGRPDVLISTRYSNRRYDFLGKF
ncbi:hypothetical protein [Chryseobacterium indoltheticum]